MLFFFKKSKAIYFLFLLYKKLYLSDVKDEDWKKKILPEADFPWVCRLEVWNYRSVTHVLVPVTMLAATA